MMWSKRVNRHAITSVLVLCTVVLGILVLPDTSSAAPRTKQTGNLPTIGRAEVLARAQTWVDAGVPYNQKGYWQKQYREDCVGFVSMAWDAAPAPGMGTTVNALRYVTVLSKNDLLPGDALLNLELTRFDGHL